MTNTLINTDKSQNYASDRGQTQKGIYSFIEDVKKCKLVYRSEKQISGFLGSKAEGHVDCKGVRGSQPPRQPYRNPCFRSPRSVESPPTTIRVDLYDQ